MGSPEPTANRPWLQGFSALADISDVCCQAATGQHGKLQSASSLGVWDGVNICQRCILVFYILLCPLPVYIDRNLWFGFCAGLSARLEVIQTSHLPSGILAPGLLVLYSSSVGSTKSAADPGPSPEAARTHTGMATSAAVLEVLEKTNFQVNCSAVSHFTRWETRAEHLFLFGFPRLLCVDYSHCLFNHHQGAFKYGTARSNNITSVSQWKTMGEKKKKISGDLSVPFSQPVKTPCVTLRELLMKFVK